MSNDDKLLKEVVNGIKNAEKNAEKTGIGYYNKSELVGIFDTQLRRYLKGKRDTFKENSENWNKWNSKLLKVKEGNTKYCVMYRNSYFLKQLEVNSLTYPDWKWTGELEQFKTIWKNNK